MQKLQKQLKWFMMYAMGFIPTKLPIGMEAFDQFCTELFETYSLPDNPSYRHAIASQIMHLGPIVHLKPRRYFQKSILKAMANQIAYLKIQEMKALEQKFIAETMAKPEVTPRSEPQLEPLVQDQRV